MATILVIGASGFVGGRLATALLAEGHAVRCLARTPAKLQDLAASGCTVISGDIADPAAVMRAMDGVYATYISIHTLSPQPFSRQPGGAAGPRFMDAEARGIQNVIDASRAQGAQRVIYLTSVGITRDSSSEWLRERWSTEQALLDSGLHVTVLQPGQIVGIGGRGFDTVLAQAKKRLAVTIMSPRSTMRTIAVDDLVYYLTAILDDPRTYGHRYVVGNDDVLSVQTMIDEVADVLGRAHPAKVTLPHTLLVALAPWIDRRAKLGAGAMRGLLDGMRVEASGDPMPIRALLPRPLLSFRQAVERALST